MIDLVPTDTGTYTCNVSNAYGWINHTYYVDVHGKNKVFSRPQTVPRWKRGGLMVSALYSGSSDPRSGPGRGHCVMFLGKILYSHSASLHPGV